MIPHYFYCYCYSRHVGSFHVSHMPSAMKPSTSTATSSQLALSLKHPFSKVTKKENIKKLIKGAAMALVTLSLCQAPALAAKAEAVEHLHTGQKIANFFMKFGLPKWAVLATISAMPVVELRGAIPVGIWLGMPISQVLPICVLGNMTPIVPLLFLLRNEALKYVSIIGKIHTL